MPNIKLTNKKADRLASSDPLTGCPRMPI